MYNCCSDFGCAYWFASSTPLHSYCPITLEYTLYILICVDIFAAVYLVCALNVAGAEQIWTSHADFTTAHIIFLQCCSFNELTSSKLDQETFLRTQKIQVFEPIMHIWTEYLLLITLVSLICFCTPNIDMAAHSTQAALCCTLLKENTTQ